jgi:hypothetical protein
MASVPAKMVILLTDMSLLPIGKAAVVSLGERSRSRSFIRFAREEAEQEFIRVTTDEGRGQGMPLRRMNHLKASVLLSGIK